MDKEKYLKLTKNVSAAIARENFNELVRFTSEQMKNVEEDKSELVATALVSEITSEVAAETAAEIVAETSIAGRL